MSIEHKRRGTKLRLLSFLKHHDEQDIIDNVAEKLLRVQISANHDDMRAVLHLYAAVSFGFPLTLGIVDVTGKNAIGHWVHPRALTQISISGRFDPKDTC